MLGSNRDREEKRSSSKLTGLFVHWISLSSVCPGECGNWRVVRNRDFSNGTANTQDRMALVKRKKKAVFINSPFQRKRYADLIRKDFNAAGSKQKKRHMLKYKTDFGNRNRYDKLNAPRSARFRGMIFTDFTFWILLTGYIERLTP